MGPRARLSSQEGEGVPRVTAVPQTWRATDLDGAGGQGLQEACPPRGKRKEKTVPKFDCIGVG